MLTSCFFKQKGHWDTDGLSSIMPFIKENNLEMDINYLNFIASHDLEISIPKYYNRNSLSVSGDSIVDRSLVMVENSINPFAYPFQEGEVFSLLAVGSCDNGNKFQLGNLCTIEFVLFQLKNLFNAKWKEETEWYDNFLQIGITWNNHGGIFISLNENDYGSIYLFDEFIDRASESEVYKFPYDFTTFIRNLNLHIVSSNRSGGDFYYNIGTCEDLSKKFKPE